MILDEPTRGIDIGAKAEIYELMRALADAGVAVLMISSDMEEVMGVSDRIAGHARGPDRGHSCERAEFSEENVLRLAVGTATSRGSASATGGLDAGKKDLGLLVLILVVGRNRRHHQSALPARRSTLPTPRT